MFQFIQSIQSRDPSNPSTLEIILAYPGFHIIGFYKLSSFLWRYRLRALARFVSYFGRFITGIEIHPGARIGKNLFIDHGTGTVIGETAIVGDDVTLYQNVALGSRGAGSAGKRHPTLKNKVVVGAGAVIVGDITIGENVIVRANSVVTSDMPDV